MTLYFQNIKEINNFSLQQVTSGLGNQEIIIEVESDINDISDINTCIQCDCWSDDARLEDLTKLMKDEILHNIRSEFLIVHICLGIFRIYTNSSVIADHWKSSSTGAFSMNLENFQIEYPNENEMRILKIKQLAHKNMLMS